MGHPVASVVRRGAGEERGERSNTVNTIVAVQEEKNSLLTTSGSQLIIYRLLMITYSTEIKILSGENHS